MTQNPLVSQTQTNPNPSTNNNGASLIADGVAVSLWVSLADDGANLPPYIMRCQDSQELSQRRRTEDSEQSRVGIHRLCGDSSDETSSHVYERLGAVTWQYPFINRRGFAQWPRLSQPSASFGESRTGIPPVPSARTFTSGTSLPRTIKALNAIAKGKGSEKRVNGGIAGGAFARNMHVKIKKSEITIEVSMSYLALSVPRTGALILNWNKSHWNFAECGILT